MTMNKFHFNELKKDTWKCDWLIGHIIYINDEWSFGSQLTRNGMSGNVPKDEDEVR